MDGAGDGGALYAEAVGDLPHIEPLTIIEKKVFPLEGGDLLLKGPDQIPLEALVLRTVVRADGAGVDRHIGRKGNVFLPMK